jgi:hypothetical protein
LVDRVSAIIDEGEAGIEATSSRFVGINPYHDADQCEEERTPG